MNGIFSNQFGRQHLGASSTLMSHSLEPHAVAFFCTLTRFRVSSRVQERTAGGGWSAGANLYSFILRNWPSADGTHAQAGCEFMARPRVGVAGSEKKGEGEI